MFEIGRVNDLGIALSLLIGGLLALLIGFLRGRRCGVPTRTLWVLTGLLPLCTAFCSHLLYCLVCAGTVLYEQPVWYLLAFWREGHMVYGGLCGLVLAICLIGASNRRVLLDAYAPAVLLMLAAARIAEGFLGQGYGDYAFEETAFSFFPIMMFDAYDELWALALFVWEAFIALLLCAFSLKMKPRFAGDVFLRGLGFFAAAQIVLESLRRDEFLRWGFVRVEELASAIALLIVLICYCVHAGRGKALQKTLCFTAFFLLVTLCILLEFATEGRIPFLLFLDVNACYLVMAAACAAMAGCVCAMRALCQSSPILTQRRNCA